MNRFFRWALLSATVQPHLVRGRRHFLPLRPIVQFSPRIEDDKWKRDKFAQTMTSQVSVQGIGTPHNHPSPASGFGFRIVFAIVLTLLDLCLNNAVVLAVPGQRDSIDAHLACSKCCCKQR